MQQQAPTEPVAFIEKKRKKIIHFLTDKFSLYPDI